MANRKHRSFMVSEQNARLAARKDFNSHIHYIPNENYDTFNPYQLNTYIKTHPKEDMIAFMVEFPPAMTFDAVHVCPILYVKNKRPGAKTKHSFIVFDCAAQGLFLPMLLESDEDTNSIEQHFHFVFLEFMVG